MARVITNVSFDLKYDVLSTPPSIRVNFTDQDASGAETHGSTTITDAAAAAVFPTDLLAAVNAAIDAQAAQVPDMLSLAARITEADKAEARRKEAAEAVEALDAEIEAKRAALVELAAMTPAT